MNNKFSVRAKNHAKFIEVIKLRKNGLSYGEIRKIIPVAKSTINNWITLVGLNLSPEHLKIQTIKRLKNHEAGTIAAKITKARKKEMEIQTFNHSIRAYFADPFFISGIMLYEAEGAKGATNNFSNSDPRLIKIYVKFLEKYLYISKNNSMRFRLYIHTTRKNDLSKIINYWTTNLQIPPRQIRISWKRNHVTKLRKNKDYHGQISVSVVGFRYLTSKLLGVSDIILKTYLRN